MEAKEKAQQIGAELCARGPGLALEPGHRKVP